MYIIYVTITWIYKFPNLDSYTATTPLIAGCDW